MPSEFPAPGELLPHRPPMLLLHTVLSHQPEETVCQARFDLAFIQACGSEVSAAFGLELIAQAAAVHHGLRGRAEAATARVNEGASGGIPTAATRGLLLGSRRLTLGARTLPTNEALYVTVLDGGQGPGIGGLVRFEGRVTNGAGDVLASGDATVLEWRPDAGAES